MKILNKKGFILVETLIVTVFVMTIFMVIYKNVVPYVGEYEKLETFDDVDSVYAANMIKQMLVRYGNFEYIDTKLAESSYFEIQDCNDSRIYINSKYCKTIKETLGITENDYIIVTKYNISDFKNKTSVDEKFDSGKLSNFRDYINTLYNEDPFYKESTANLAGKYRIFITRTVLNQDNTTTLKFANLGVYVGKSKRYDMGNLVKFNPGDGIIRDFYVFKNSPTTEDTVKLIPASNLNKLVYNPVCKPMDLENFIFESSDCNNVLPNNINNYINTLKNSWNNAISIKLLEINDLNEIIDCDGQDTCFDNSNTISKNILESYSYLSSNTNNNGYWLSNYINNGTYEMGWVIENNKVKPAFVNKEYGIRPIIMVYKNKLEG